MSKEAWVPYAYWLEVLPARARKTKWNRLRGEMPVTFHEVDALECPRALVEAYDRNADGGNSRWGRSDGSRKSTWTKENLSIGPSTVKGKETVTAWSAGHAGKLWRPLSNPGRGEFCSLDELLGASAAEKWRDHPFLGAADRAKFAEMPTRDAVVNMRVKEVRTDTEERVMAALQRTALNLLVVDGKLWRVQSEPAWCVGLDGKDVSVSLVRPYRNERASGVTFGADALPDAIAFAEALAARRSETAAKPARVAKPYRRIESVDAAYLGKGTEGTAAILVGNAVLRAMEPAKEARRLVDALAPMREALDTRLHATGLATLVGDPYAFANTLSGWADDLRAYPHEGSWDREEGNALAQVFDTLAVPLQFGAEYGLSASGNDFMSDEDIDFLASFAPAP